MGAIGIVGTTATRLAVGARADVTGRDEPEGGESNEKSCSEMHGFGSLACAESYKCCDYSSDEEWKMMLDSKLVAAKRAQLIYLKTHHC